MASRSHTEGGVWEQKAGGRSQLRPDQEQDCVERAHVVGYRAAALPRYYSRFLPFQEVIIYIERETQVCSLCIYGDILGDAYKQDRLTLRARSTARMPRTAQSSAASCGKVARFKPWIFALL